MEKRNRLDLWIWLAGIASAALAAAVFSALLGRPQSDIAIHTLWAGQASLADLKSFIRQAAHPLWRVCVFVITQTGLTVNQSALLFTALCKGLETVALYALAARLIGRRGPVAALCALAASVVASVWVPWINPTVFLGGGSPNPWHSPTQIALMAPMILAVSWVAMAEERNLREKENISRKHAALLSTVLLISALIKPTFLQAFLPAAGIYFLVRWVENPGDSRYFLRLLLAAVPAVLAILLEFLFYFGGIVESQGGLTVLFSGAKTLEVLKLVLLTQLFPLCVLVLFADRETLRQPLFTLTLLLDGIAVLQMLFLSETGYRAQDGNFGWAVMGAGLMLWAVTLPLFAYRVSSWVKRLRSASQGQPTVVSRPRAQAVKIAAGSGLLLWHLASGVWYVMYLLTTQNAL